MKFLLSVLSMVQLDLVMYVMPVISLFMFVKFTNPSSYQEEIF